MCGQYYKYPFPANLARENQPHEYPRTSLPFMLVASTFLRVFFFFFLLQKNPKETLVLAEEFLCWALFCRKLPIDFPADFPILLLFISFHQIHNGSNI